jgi:hypothetical protein
MNYFLDCSWLDELQHKVSGANLSVKHLIPDVDMFRAFENYEPKNNVKLDQRLEKAPLEVLIALWYVQRDDTLRCGRDVEFVIRKMKYIWGYDEEIDFSYVLSLSRCRLEIDYLVSRMFERIRSTEERSYIFASDLMTPDVIHRLFPALIFVTGAKGSDLHRPFQLFGRRDVDFQFILPRTAIPAQWCDGRLCNANEMSYVLKLTHKRTPCCSFLFTGDIGPDNLDCIIGRRSRPSSIQALLEEIPDDLRSQCPTVPRPTSKELSREEDQFFRENRLALRAIGVVYAPHHGSDRSTRIISYLMQQHRPPSAVIVNSAVWPPDNIPDRSMWEITPRSHAHPAHFICYGSIDGKNVRLTKKSVYVTECAPGGAFWAYSDGCSIWLYLAHREIPNQSSTEVGFIPITPVVRTPEAFTKRRIRTLARLVRETVNDGSLAQYGPCLSDPEWGLFSLFPTDEDASEDRIGAILRESPFAYLARRNSQIQILRGIVLKAQELAKGEIPSPNLTFSGEQMMKLAQAVAAHPKEGFRGFTSEGEADPESFDGHCLHKYVQNHIIELSPIVGLSESPIYHPISYGTDRLEKHYRKQMSITDLARNTERAPAGNT